MAKTKVVFTYEAPHAKSVSVAGCFTGWTDQPVTLKQLKSGVWKATVSLETGRYEYRYLVDGQWCDDPAATQRAPNPHGTENCIREVGGAGG
jgi:1,4-alpha-glucan branching enzyme